MVKVDVEFCLTTPLKHTATGLASYPVIIMAPDYDDAVAPVTDLELMEYGKNCQIVQFGSDKPTIRISMVPRVSNTVYRTGVTSGYSLAAANTLVDAANADIPHYGLKTFVKQFNSTSYTGGFITLQVRYHLRLVATR